MLHDIFRFQEVRGWYETGKKIDHGIEGAKFLSLLTDFNNILITLPIKHHGHMIERMYEDEAYQALDEATKDQVKHIAFAVRDADKIANWYLLNTAWDQIKEVWFHNPDDFSVKEAKINDKLWAYFINKEVAPNSLRQTNADHILAIICWLFDMNYAYSIYYCKKLKLFEGWLKILKKFNVEDNQIKAIHQTMKDFVLDRFKMQI